MSHFDMVNIWKWATTFSTVNYDIITITITLKKKKKRYKERRWECSEVPFISEKVEYIFTPGCEGEVGTGRVQRWGDCHGYSPRDLVLSLYFLKVNNLFRWRIMDYMKGRWYCHCISGWMYSATIYISYYLHLLFSVSVYHFLFCQYLTD